MSPSTGTFTTMDTYQGSIFDPTSLHKYLYANANPVTYVDPSGYMTTHQDLEAGMAGSAEIDKAQASHSSFAFKVFKNLMKKVASGVAGGLIAVGDQVSAGVTDRDQLALAFRKGFLAGFAFSFVTGKVAMALRYTLPFAGAVFSVKVISGKVYIGSVGQLLAVLDYINHTLIQRYLRTQIPVVRLSASRHQVLVMHPSTKKLIYGRGLPFIMQEQVIYDQILMMNSQIPKLVLQRECFQGIEWKLQVIEAF